MLGPNLITEMDLVPLQDSNQESATRTLSLCQLAHRRGALHVYEMS